MSKGISPLVFAGMLAAILLAGVVFVVRSVAQDTGSIDQAAARALSDYGAANVAAAAADALPTFAAVSLDPIVTISAPPAVYAAPTLQTVTIELPTPTVTPWPTPTAAPARWRTEYRGEWQYIELPPGWMPCYLFGIGIDGGFAVAHQDWAGYVMAQPQHDIEDMGNLCINRRGE